MFNLNKKLNIKNIFLILAVVSFVLFVYRSAFSDSLFGDPFDARLHIVLHEHWWSFFNGKTSLRNTNFFYPFDKGLGFSDAFVVQGTIYSMLRFFNFDIVSAWIVTRFILLIIGNLGWVFIAIKYLKNFFFQLIFTLTMISSLTFVNYFTLNPNSAGYTFLSWLALLYLSAQNEIENRKKNIKILGLILFIVIYTLFCWYAAFFAIYVIFVKKFIDLIYLKKFKKFQLNKINFRIILFFSPFICFFIGLFIYIYLPILNQPDRSIEDLIKGSPRFQFLPNGGGLPGTGVNGAIFGKVYDFLGLNLDIENKFGIGIFICLFSIFFGIFYFKRFYKNYPLIIWPISFILSYTSFVLVGNFSLFSILYSRIPGFDSIRYPSRFTIVFGYFLIFCVFYMFDNLFTKSKNIFWKFIIVICILVSFFDQIRSPYKGWSKDLLTNKYLFSQADEIKSNCDYFYFDYPGGWWIDQIEAITFSMQIGVPTVNGYSGGFPLSYPQEPFLSEKLPFKIFNWISLIPKKYTGCFITGIGPVHIIKPELTALELAGFTSLETNGKDSWNWAVTKDPFLYVINLNSKEMEINFKVKSSQCNDSNRFTIVDSTNRVIKDLIVENYYKDITLNIQFNNEKIKKLDFISDLKKCNIGDDPRPLYFEIKNLNYSKK